LRKRLHKKLIHEGKYVAEVGIELFDDEGGWSPYLSLDDARKLDTVRKALRRGDIKSAGRLARIFTLKAVAI